MDAIFPPNLDSVSSFDASGSPLVRFTGGLHDWSTSLPRIAYGSPERTTVRLAVMIQTGGDDLRGGSNPGDNADVVLTLASGASWRFTNLNGGRTWSNNQKHWVILQPLPPDLKMSQATTFTLHTQFGGGISGDNWNVDRIQLFEFFEKLPMVTAVTPSSVPFGTATNITITGMNFFNVEWVGLSCDGSLQFTVNSPTEIVAPVPGTLDEGTCVVEVRTAGGFSQRPLQSIGNDVFSVTPTITGITPASGPAGGGTEVTINGSGLFQGFYPAPIYFGNN